MRKRLHDATGRRPTLADVARLAGVSTATISRCLNTPAAVSPATRAKVLATIEALGFELDATARALASGRTMTVGAVVPTLDNAIFASGIQGLQARLAADGYTLLLASSEYDPAQEIAQVRALLQRGADGLMLIGQDHPDEVFERLAQRGVPYVLTWTLSLAHPSVGFDNAALAGEVAAYLWSIGHRRIAMIAGRTAGNDRARDRLAGVRAVIRARGGTLPGSHVLERDYAIDEGREAMRALLSLDPRPSAVTCGNDVLAFGALFEAQAQGLAVPADISITGFDDLPLAAALTPALTTVAVPAAAMGRRAAEYLLRRLAGATAAARTELPTSLILRGSTGPPLQHAPVRPTRSQV